MKSKLLKPVVLLILGIIVLALVPNTPANASWYAQQIQGLSNQQTKTALPATGTTPQNTGDLSLAQLIREQRNQKLNAAPPATGTSSSVNNTTQTQPQPQQNPPIPTQGYSSEQNQLVDLINQERVQQGLKPLIVHPVLMDLAQKKSQEMKDKNYFAHTSPTYGSFAFMVATSGIKYRSIGENLAEARNVKVAHILLMASQLHKENILRAGFTHVGVGIVYTQYGVIVTELFITQ
ncbi:MAG: CAP domain-containing protein [Bacillota bacterium]